MDITLDQIAEAISHAEQSPTSQNEGETTAERIYRELQQASDFPIALKEGISEQIALDRAPADNDSEPHFEDDLCEFLVKETAYLAGHFNLGRLKDFGFIYQKLDPLLKEKTDYRRVNLSTVQGFIDGLISVLDTNLEKKPSEEEDALNDRYLVFFGNEITSLRDKDYFSFQLLISILKGLALAVYYKSKLEENISSYDSLGQDPYVINWPISAYNQKMRSIVQGLRRRMGSTTESLEGSQGRIHHIVQILLREIEPPEEIVIV